MREVPERTISSEAFMVVLALTGKKGGRLSRKTPDRLRTSSFTRLALNVVKDCYAHLPITDLLSSRYNPLYGARIKLHRVHDRIETWWTASVNVP